MGWCSGGEVMSNIDPAFDVALEKLHPNWDWGE